MFSGQVQEGPCVPWLLLSLAFCSSKADSVKRLIHCKPFTAPRYVYLSNYNRRIWKLEVRTSPIPVSVFRVRRNSYPVDLADSLVPCLSKNHPNLVFPIRYSISKHTLGTPLQKCDLFLHSIFIWTWKTPRFLFIHRDPACYLSCTSQKLHQQEAPNSVGG